MQRLQSTVFLLLTQKKSKFKRNCKTCCCVTRFMNTPATLTTRFLPQTWIVSCSYEALCNFSFCFDSTLIFPQLDEAEEYDDRRTIRAAIRLLKKKQKGKKHPFPNLSCVIFETFAKLAGWSATTTKSYRDSSF